ncbi:RNA-binding cell elongation regulator Jag/EloR [Faecalimonas umbilicata]|uniref:RNA-binding cell elongation regulator Jag/EloR n=1 Tax=Faecalimonas umbilicata TaxID=1912855 RepID=UPI0022E2AE60|nr:RNA-binding cell elongation regulator Jag/EloR [Faecalimonas umbilicata]
MEEIRVSAKTLSDAITEALIQLGVTSDQLEYDVIEKGSSGFLGIGAKQAVISARRKKTAEAPVELEEIKFDKPKVKPEPKREEKRSSVKVTEETIRESEKFLQDVLKTMDMEVKIHSEVDSEGTLCIELEGEHMGILIGKRGQTLDSLQYLTNRVANKTQDGYIRVKLDTENYRARRKATLENLAKNIAHKVKRTRKPVSLEPMNPYERRIIHSVLQSDKYVSTHSEGEEPYRRVVITPSRRQ